ncbi:hypothetical protein HanPSC8_Chr15g0676791 [Helianthus annuus]|nr:hypothetical protein HanPSC8_Chr15g0676791 [Helianthus annuus]
MVYFGFGPIGPQTLSLYLNQSQFCLNSLSSISGKLQRCCHLAETLLDGEASASVVFDRLRLAICRKM